MPAVPGRAMGLVGWCCVVVGSMAIGSAWAGDDPVFDMDEDPVPASGEAAGAGGAPTAGAEARDMDSGTGTLAANLISEVLKKNQSNVQDCVTRHGGGTLSGRMVVQWEILETGGVANVVVKESNVRNPPFESCLVSSVRRLKFAAPSGGTVITSNPFVFQI